ncbi:hypothetical protein F383_15713 [Gossypium arboreum]|uniref:Uncharacterized protein n=1 Tax=Gossypium arboreum TaxID=29729 RepID=A0A0B0N8G5_GOSAR|nr:hypothetical protein F383_15713 [Gossypium arboreum]
MGMLKELSKVELLMRLQRQVSLVATVFLRGSQQSPFSWRVAFFK